MIRAGIRRVFQLAVRRRDRWERDVEDEIKLHLLLRTEQLAARGAAPDDAYREAVRKFGPLAESRARMIDAATHREHQMQRTEFLDDLRQDIGFAFRTLGRQKGWTAITILTLALGIGATTAVFSVVSTLLLHGVPYPGADRVVIVRQQPSEGNNTGVRVSITPAAPTVNAWRSGGHGFEALEPYTTRHVLLRTDAEPAPVYTTSILPSFVSFAGQRPVIGRLFSAAEMDNKTHVALLGEQIWRSRYGADKSVIGKQLTVDDSTYTVIGVLPAALRTPSIGNDPTDVWLPLDMKNQDNGLSVVGRLRPGVTLGAAARELDALAAHANAYPTIKPGEQPRFVSEIQRPSALVDFRSSLIMLTAAVGLVLLVACANVAHMLMARAASRQRELAVRTALGAGRGRLFRQLLTESLIIALAGSVAGVLFGWLGLKALIGLRPAGMTELSAAHLDGTTLALSIALGAASGIVFGVIGAMQTSRRSTRGALAAGTLAASASRGHDRLRSLLIVSEMALSGTLIVGAALLVRSVINMQRVNLGFEPKDLYALNLFLPKSRYATPASRNAFVNELTSRLRGVAGVRDVAVASAGPGSRNFSIGQFQVSGEATSPSAAASSFVDVNNIDDNYFRTMGIRIVQGTLFTDHDTAAHQILINEGFARKHWPTGSALGHRVRVANGTHGDWETIVGVAADASTTGPGSESAGPLLYSPRGDASNFLAVMVRTAPGADIVRPVAALVRSIDPALPASPVKSAEGIIFRSAIETPRFTMVLLTIFTALALALAAVGLYGVMAYSVAQRTREIGIRMALGASRGAIARVVIVRGVTLAVLGAAVGLSGAYWATRLVRSLLYNVAPLDPASFAIGAVVLIGAAVVACVVPTRRALAVDPILAIRAE
jgi:putative ABC transport system permease protein